MNNLRDKKILLEFGKHLREIRKQKELSLQGLAFEAEMEISQVYRIEKGIVNPTLTTLFSLSKALGVTLKDLMDF